MGLAKSEVPNRQRLWLASVSKIATPTSNQKFGLVWSIHGSSEMHLC